MKFINDPYGKAISAYINGKKGEEIIVHSDMCDDDVMPVDYLFRTFDEMPKIERVALSMCKGKILDVGACAGVHAQYLVDKGFQVTTLDTSKGAVEYQKSIGLSAHHQDFYLFKETGFDTLLWMMNGIGIAGTLANLENTLLKAKERLSPGGIMLCDSTDIKYLYEDDEGGFWVDLNTNYYGEFQFKNEYDGVESEEFNWLYVDYEKLKEAATNVGLEIRLVIEDGYSYLAELKRLT